MTAAFAADDTLERNLEIPGIGSFPGRVALSFHVVDYLVHGWDVATALGVPYQPADDLVAVALALASRWPDTPGTRGPGAAFGPTVTVAPDAPAFDQLLARLGRSPAWLPPGTAAP